MPPPAAVSHAQAETSGQAAYAAALRFLYDRIDYEKLIDGAGRYPFRLRRIRELAGRLGLSHLLWESEKLPAQEPPGSHSPLAPAVPLVHIAGTKGKGSVSTMVASVLSAAGLRTGLYTSPHLHRLEERFRVDGDPCTQSELVELVETTGVIANQMACEEMGAPSFFELTTAIALLHFHRKDCDAIVLEVGLGGRLDSTNVCRPSVTAITSIGLDHQHVLGDTHEQIASEKAGIIKPGIPVVSGVTQNGPQRVISDVAKENAAPLWQLGNHFRVDSRPASDWGSVIGFDAAEPLRSIQGLTVPLEGTHQARNAAVAIAVLEQLKEALGQHQNPLPISVENIRQGLAQVSTIGRMERVCLPDGRTVIIDSAHNEDSITALCDALRARFPNRELTFLFGTSVDKKAEPMLTTIGRLASKLVLTQFAGNPRYFPVDQLQTLVPQSWSGALLGNENTAAAFKQALEHTSAGGVLVICGSFFLTAETRELVYEQSKLTP